MTIGCLLIVGDISIDYTLIELTSDIDGRCQQMMQEHKFTTPLLMTMQWHRQQLELQKPSRGN